MDLILSLSNMPYSDNVHIYYDLSFLQAIIPYQSEVDSSLICVGGVSLFSFSFFFTFNL